jgi:RNA polymerase sigma-70 factor (ECF subfamily)
VPPLNERAFAALYERTKRPLWSYVYRVTGSTADADDLVQEAYCRLLRADIATFSAEAQRRYLFRAAGNLMTDRWRRAERERAWQAQVEPPSAGSQPCHDEVTRTFQILKPRERALLWLAYVEQETHAEIAAALGVRPGSVRVLLSRARSRLRELLQASEQVTRA